MLEKKTKPIDLNENEIEYIKETEGMCPDCGNAILTEGPHEGSSRDFECKGCKSKFKLYFLNFYCRWADITRGVRF